MNVPCRVTTGNARPPVVTFCRSGAVTGLAALARRAYRRWHQSFTFLSSGRNYTLVHPRPPHFDAIAEDGRGIAGSPATVLAALRKQIAETGANYVVGQFAFGDMTTAETLDSLNLFTRRVMPELRL